MALLEKVPIAGLYSLDDNNLIPFDRALSADDCFVDTDAVVPRNGYRSLTAAAILGSGTPQFLGRFRPSLSSARTVAVVNGHILLITDASSDTASDGTVTDLGATFGSSANVSGAQLATNFYLGSDDGTCLQRIDSSYALHALCGLPTPLAPTAALGGTLTWTAFSGITPTVSGCVLQDNTKTGFSGMPSTWRGFTATDNGNNDPAKGSYAYYKLAANFDASGCDWLAVAVSPHTQDRFPFKSWTVEVDVAADNAGSPGTFEAVGTIYDTTGQAGSPNAIFCDLRTLDSTTRSAVRYIRFLLTWIQSDSSHSGGKFVVYGYLFLPGKPADPPPFNYYIDLYDPATGAQSDLSPVLVVNGTNASVQSYPDCYMNWGQPTNTGGSDSLFGANSARVFNVTAPLEMPAIEEIGEVVTVSGNAPAFSGFASVTVRLWKDTSSGRRLVGSQAGVASGGPYSIIDNGGIGVLANDLFKAGGNPPPLLSLGASAGRLVAGNGNRLYVSSFTPTSDTTNPIPQWPAVALEDADGWSVDIAPSPREQILSVNGDGDAVYFATQERVEALSDLTPGTDPYLVFRRGVLGRQGLLYAEDRIFWAAWDGIYQAVNVSEVQEMSQENRSLYQNWLAPDANVCLGYHNRKLFVFSGQRFLRYDFVKNRWTRGTLNDTVRMVVSYSDPDGTGDKMLLLTTSRFIGRWQASATRDMEIGTNTATGVAIPSWTYSTGFFLQDIPMVVKGLLLDATGDIAVTIAKTVTVTGVGNGRTFTVTKDNTLAQDESWTPCPGDFTFQKVRLGFSGANNVTLRRAMFERMAVSEKKGG